MCVCTRVWRSCVCECVFPEFYWDCGHVERREEAIRLQQRKYITEHLSSNKITCIICCGNPCPTPFLPCLALSLFFLSSTFLSSSFQHRCADSVTVKKKRMPPPHPATHCPVSLSLWMREGYHWLFIFAWTSHDSVLQPTGKEADCITGRASVCALVLNCEGVQLENTPLGCWMLLVPLLLSPLE